MDQQKKLAEEEKDVELKNVELKDEEELAEDVEGDNIFII